MELYRLALISLDLYSSAMIEDVWEVLFRPSWLSWTALVVVLTRAVLALDRAFIECIDSFVAKFMASGLLSFLT